MDAPLHVQAAKLKNKLQNREKRRNEERAHRHEAAVRAGDDTVYDGAPAKRTHVGSTAAVAALTAISAASSGPVAPVIPCDLCKATFSSELQYQQHLAGPVHRKAVERAKAEAEQRMRRAPYNSVAEAALGAAAWNTTHGSDGRGGGGGSGSGGHAHGGRGGGSGGQGGSALRQAKAAQARALEAAAAEAEEAKRRAALPSHAELVAAARADHDAELDIGGWVPPSVAAAMPTDHGADGPAGTAAGPSDAGEPTSSPPAHGRGVSSDADGAGGTSSSSGGSGAGGGLLGLAYGGSDKEDDAQEGATGNQSSDSDPGSDSADEGGPVPVSFF